MSLLLSEIYDALKEAGASEEKARKAAEAIAGYEDRFAKIDREFAEVRSTQRLQSWMLGYLILVTTTLLWRVFTL
jgi:hypothetical protein